MKEKIKILYTSKEQGFPAVGGPKLRIENSIRALNQISQLYLVSQVTPEELGGDKAIELYKNISKEFCFAPTAQSASGFIGKVIRWVKRRTNCLAKFIVQKAHENDIRIIWVGYGNISYRLMKQIKKLDQNLVVISDTDSVWSRFLLRELSCEEQPRKRKRIIKYGQKKEREEIEWTDLCDCVTAVSEIDAEYYRSLTVNQKKIKVFSNVINLESYNVKQYKEDGRKVDLYLAGSFWENSPMEKAARWVIDMVLPIIWTTHPETNFYIVGNNSDKILNDITDARIHVCGRVDSVLPYLCNAKVALVPLKFESGTRFKILEAGACKIPIVSTTLGAEGIPVKHRENILLADDEMSFAAAVIELLENPALAEDIAENCYNLIAEKYCVDSLAKEGQKILDYLYLNK